MTCEIDTREIVPEMNAATCVYQNKRGELVKFDVDAGASMDDEKFLFADIMFDSSLMKKAARNLRAAFISG